MSTLWTRDTLLAALVEWRAERQPHPNLVGANLRDADLRDAENTETAIGLYPIAPEFGAFWGVKKLDDNRIAIIEIPADSPRVGGWTGRKCRCLYAWVREILDAHGNAVTVGYSLYDAMEYRVGAMVIAEGFDPDPRVECAGGIHFFLSRREAEEYQ